MKIGVFDSGLGGLSVANAIKKSIPELDIVVQQDKEHVPYGTRSPEEILSFIKPIFQEMIERGCEVIIIACNTVSTNLMPELRRLFKVSFIAVEPMIKYAAKISKSKTITVCATPTTLASARYKDLKKRYAKNLTVLEPDCSDWAHMIEQRQIDERRIKTAIEATLGAGSDVIVLGCTHYHWIEKEIKNIAETRAQILQPEPIVIGQLKQLLKQLS